MEEHIVENQAKRLAEIEIRLQMDNLSLTERCALEDEKSELLQQSGQKPRFTCNSDVEGCLFCSG